MPNIALQQSNEMETNEESDSAQSPKKEMYMHSKTGSESPLSHNSHSASSTGERPNYLMYSLHKAGVVDVFL